MRIVALVTVVLLLLVFVLVYVPRAMFALKLEESMIGWLTQHGDSELRVAGRRWRWAPGVLEGCHPEAFFRSEVRGTGQAGNPVRYRLCVDSDGSRVAELPASP